MNILRIVANARRNRFLLQPLRCASCVFSEIGAATGEKIYEERVGRW